MTRLYHGGAEAGHIHAEGGVGSGGPGIDTTIKRSGTRSWIMSTSATMFVQVAFTGATARRYFATQWFYVPNASGLPGTDARIVHFSTSGGTLLCSAFLTTTGKIQLRDQSDSQIGSDSAATVSTDTWHRLDLGVQINAGSTDYAEVRLNGVSVASTTTGAFSDTAPGILAFGWITDPGTSEVIHFDDIILNDNQGAANLTWALDEKVVLLTAASVSARDTNWVGGAGGTTNLQNAVNNIPPAGLDNAAATDTSQVENAASTTTQEIDFVTTTYTAAGIGSTDLITAIYGVMEGGNSSTTGTDTIGLELEANPVIAETVVNVDVNDNTYPTGWNRGATAIIEGPRVTMGTGATISLRKGVATTRVCTCCFVGVYVSYLPDPTAAAAGDMIASETFTDSAGTLLQTHDADWTRDDPASSGDPDDAVITDDNRLRIETTPTVSVAWYRNTGNAPVSANYAVGADIIPDTVSGVAAVSARSDTGTGGYAVFAYPAFGGWLLANRDVSVAYGGAAESFVADQVYAVELRCHDDYKAVFIDGVLRILSLDNSTTAAGHAGLLVSDSPGSNTTSFQIDNWEAQDYDTAATDVEVTTTVSTLSLGNTSATISAAASVTTTLSNNALGSTSATIGAGSSVIATVSDTALGSTSATITSTSSVATTVSDVALGGNSAAMGVSDTVATTVSTNALGNTSATITSTSSVTTTLSDMALGNTSAVIGAGSSVIATTSGTALGNTSATITNTSTVATTLSDLALGGNTATATQLQEILTTLSTKALGGGTAEMTSPSGDVEVFTTVSDMALGGTSAVIAISHAVNATVGTLSLGGGTILVGPQPLDHFYAYII